MLYQEYEAGMRVVQRTIDGSDRSHGLEHFIISENESLPSWHLFNEVIKCDVGPVDIWPVVCSYTRPRRPCIYSSRCLTTI